MVAVSLKKKSSRRRHKGRAEDGIRDVERSRCFFFQAEDGIRDVERSRGLGDVYKRQLLGTHIQLLAHILSMNFLRYLRLVEYLTVYQLR